MLRFFKNNLRAIVVTAALGAGAIIAGQFVGVQLEKQTIEPTQEIEEANKDEPIIVKDPETGEVRSVSEEEVKSSPVLQKQVVNNPTKQDYEAAGVNPPETSTPKDAPKPSVPAKPVTPATPNPPVYVDDKIYYSFREESEGVKIETGYTCSDRRATAVPSREIESAEKPTIDISVYICPSWTGPIESSNGTFWHLWTYEKDSQYINKTEHTCYVTVTQFGQSTTHKHDNTKCSDYKINSGINQGV